MRASTLLREPIIIGIVLLVCIIGKSDGCEYTSVYKCGTMLQICGDWPGPFPDKSNNGLGPNPFVFASREECAQLADAISQSGGVCGNKCTVSQDGGNLQDISNTRTYDCLGNLVGVKEECGANSDRKEDDDTEVLDVQSPSWEGVASKTNEIGAICMSDEAFRERIDQGAIVRRVCESCIESHRHIYYKRLTPLPDPTEYFNIPPNNFLDVFLNHWMDAPANQLNVDFELYSSYQDAKKGKRKERWTYCNFYSDIEVDNDVGFPRDCGPTEYIPNQWTSFQRPSKDFALQIETASGSNEVSADCKPSFRVDNGEVGSWLSIASKRGETKNICFTDAELRNQIKKSNGIIRTSCPSCSWTHKFVYYKRLTPLPSTMDFVGEVAVDFMDLFLNNWMSTPKNEFNVDFELYSSYQDALDGTNRWLFCNADDPSVGFPRDCGPWGEVRDQWIAFDRPRRPDFVLEVEELFPGSSAGDHQCGPPPRICKATGWGDPHIVTFDGLKYDAQAHGEVIMMQSLDSNFMVQARFETLPSATVTTGIVIRESDRQLPQVQVSLAHDPEAPLTVNGCPVELYIGGARRDIIEGYRTDQVVAVTIDGNKVQIEFPEAYYTMTVVDVHDKCHFNVDYRLLNDCRPNENLVGLLGNADNNQWNDWMDRSGDKVSIPTGENAVFFEPAYNYVAENWCIETPQESLFTYEPGKDFFDFAFCGDPYDPSLETAIDEADPDILDLCNGDLGCLVDAVALGRDAAEVYLENEAVDVTASPSVSPAPTTAPCTSGRRKLSQLEETWEISEDIGFVYESNKFELTFEISDRIADTSQVQQELLQFNCEDVYNGDSVRSLVGSSFEANSNVGKQNIGVDITIEPSTIFNDMETFEYRDDGGNLQATVDFCLRFALSTPASAGSMEVNFLEVQISLLADLTDGFDIDTVNVKPLKRCEFSVEEAFFVEGYICEEGNEAETYDMGVLNQGQVVTICVRPERSARDRLIRMRQIDSFYFTKPDPVTGLPIIQDAIVDGNPASTGLTEVFCSPGYSICHFDTILRAEFFILGPGQTLGQIAGVGQATMQFGSGLDPASLSVSPRTLRRNRQRQLRADEGQHNQEQQRRSRQLAEGGSSAGQKSPLELSFDVLSARARVSSSVRCAPNSMVVIGMMLLSTFVVTTFVLL